MFIPIITRLRGFSDDGRHGVMGLDLMGKGGSTDGKMQVGPTPGGVDQVPLWGQTETSPQIPPFTGGMWQKRGHAEKPTESLP